VDTGALADTLHQRGESSTLMVSELTALLVPLLSR
jgi:hypothetical protein